MIINRMIISYTMLVSLSVLAQNDDSLSFSLIQNSAISEFSSLKKINSTHGISNNFIIQGVQKHYLLEDNQGKIDLVITTQNDLIVTAYLFDLDGNEKVKVANVIDSQTINVTLNLNNIQAGNYRLIITALTPDQQSAIKSFNIMLVNVPN
ncbi:N-acetylglucosamine-binding protein A [Yersinia pseudotuberculosis]|nr:N-acetylglucosamine-binding protein A [Yersinia pseudotuberculosis]SUP87745.1 N-acetylglucosamine-binding protein A [Yersinia pseudotuberculosis]